MYVCMYVCMYAYIHIVYIRFPCREEKNPAKLRRIYIAYESREIFFCRAKVFNCEAHSDGRGERRPSNLREWVFLERFPRLALPRVDPFAAILL